MKKAFLLTLFFCCHYIGISQGWTSEELEKANTAVNIPSLTGEEKEVIKYINLARLYPQKFADLEVRDYYGPVKWGNYLKTSAYRESLLTTLQNKKPVGLLYFDENMYALANCYAKENGESGRIGHDRVICPTGYDAECISYGLEQAKDIALQLLIDHNVPSLGHREICLDGAYGKVGLSIQPHTVNKYCGVLDFERAALQNINKELPQTKPNNPTPKQQPATKKETVKPVTGKKPLPKKQYKLLYLKIGASANFLLDDVNKLKGAYDNEISYQLNSMLGFNLSKAKKNTSIGLFGAYGKYNAHNTTLPGNSVFSSSTNFLEIEGGFLIKELFRISGGLGYSSTNSIELTSNNYSTFSAGFSLGPKWLKFDIANTFIIPKDDKKVFFRPSLGLSFAFGVLNKKS